MRPSGLHRGGAAATVTLGVLAVVAIALFTAGVARALRDSAAPARPARPAAPARAQTRSHRARSPLPARTSAPRELTRSSLDVQAPDPEADLSFAAPASFQHARAVAPASVGAMIAPGAPSNAQVAAELAQTRAAARAQATTGADTRATIGAGGLVAPPPGVPLAIARVIAGANEIAKFPYVYGGGHASFVDDAYDCSGSVGYALAAAGLLSSPESSGEMETWGAPGPGRWLTIYTNAGHVYMFVDGLRYDTAGRTGVYSTRWQTGPDPVGGPGNSGFVARHWPGL